ncbi:GGDEF domain-containing protein [Fodinicola feengrottensis]|uniref:GGDEF domain-containing protein n=2 Tax=Fodinicola feengrottensis TaxID=435914 RepID=A0ABP4SK36_9ACTN
MVDWSRAMVLVAIGIAQAELSRRTERIRRYVAETPHVNMTSVWIGAGALLLPPALAALVTVAIYGHLWLRIWRTMSTRPTYRVVFSAATMVIACLTVSPVLRACGVGSTLGTTDHDHTSFATVVAIGAAIAAFTGVNSLLIMIGLKLQNPKRAFLPLYGSLADNALEIATLCLGGAAALLLVAHPAAAVLVLLPVIVLHRCVLMRQLTELATHDGKTGLLNDTEWRTRATTEIARAQRQSQRFAVLLIDLDHFKKVNDAHGHLAGDAVLHAVAAAISTETRAYDTIGRFGGEEFVVLLPGMHTEAAHAAAERIRAAVAELIVTTSIDGCTHVITGVTASIGIATYPDTAVAIDHILHAADTAMYRAKTQGRNQVVAYSVAAPN